MCYVSLPQSVLEEVGTGTQAGTEAETMEECSLLPCLLAGLCLVSFLTQCRTPCPGNGVSHSGLTLIYRLTRQSPRDMSTGQSDQGDPSTEAPSLETPGSVKLTFEATCQLSCLFPF